MNYKKFIPEVPSVEAVKELTLFDLFTLNDPLITTVLDTYAGNEVPFEKQLIALVIILHKVQKGQIEMIKAQINASIEEWRLK